MAHLRKDILTVGDHDGCVVLLGETGTGKELVANAIHKASGRRGDFVRVNCNAISSELFESEMFGSVRGSFTGSVRSKLGLFSAAEHGTIFLDEIGTMPFAFQGKLLRALQEKQIRKVGEVKEENITCRVIVACNSDLARKIASGEFRKDLYYRLEMFSLHVPPLRSRKEDIPEIVKHIVSKQSASRGQSVRFSAAALKKLQEYDWPGNVRELENVVIRSLVMNGDVELLQPEDIRFSPKTGDDPQSVPMTLRLPDDGLTFAELQEEAILLVLERFDYDTKLVARYFGTSKSTIQRRLSEVEKSQQEQ